VGKASRRKRQSIVPKKDTQQKHKDSTHPIMLQKWQSKILLWLSQFWKLIVVFSVVLGIIVSFLSLTPNIAVSTSQSLDPKDPLATPFVITNNGLLPIHSVEILFGINTITTPPPWNQTVKNLSLGYAKPPLAVLDAHEPKTFWCPQAIKFPVPINLGDIAILVSYRPTFLFWRKKAERRFVTEKSQDGTIYWYSKPLSEPNK
jgi:hypothetical protein